MLKFFVLFLSVLGTLSISAVPNGDLGPIRACRCYTRPTSVKSSLLRYSTFSSSSTTGHYGEAELCHCLPSSTLDTVTSPHLSSSSSSGYSSSMRAMSGLFSRDMAQQQCGWGGETHGKYTVDDYTEVRMCNSIISYGSLYQLNNIDLTGSYACGDFLFALRNFNAASGIALSITIAGQQYVAVGVGSPDVPPGVKPLTAYAQWSYGLCDGVYPTNNAVYVSKLKDSNDAFKALQDLGAYAVGMQDGYMIDHAVQCIRIENPACHQMAMY